MENDTRRGLKSSIEDVNLIFRPVLPRTSNDTLLCANWSSVITLVLAVAFATTGHVTGHGLAWAIATALAFASGVLYGVYFEDGDDS